MDHPTSRREFLQIATGAALAGASLMVRSEPAHAPPKTMQAAIDRVIGSAKVNQGRIKIVLPPLSENGNAVPLTLSVDSPMTAADHVKAIHVFTEKNPQPDVASFHLGPRAGRAHVATRIRLAATQTVVAICELSDGSFWSASANVVVTLAACVEVV
ncbi:MAG: SoxY-related AACIE arm protein [Luteimonas sp.]